MGGGDFFLTKEKHLFILQIPTKCLPCTRLSSHSCETDKTQSPLVQGLWSISKHESRQTVPGKCGILTEAVRGPGRALALCFLSLFWNSSTLGDRESREKRISTGHLRPWSQTRGRAAPSLLSASPSEPSGCCSSSALGYLTVLFCLRTKLLAISHFKWLPPQAALVYQLSVSKQISLEDSIMVGQKRVFLKGCRPPFWGCRGQPALRLLCSPLPPPPPLCPPAPALSSLLISHSLSPGPASHTSSTSLPPSA